MDGNAQNMYHGNHQGDPYYPRYDPAAAAAAAAAASPRAMGPPGGYPPRHRAPHPLQQPQYPSYQPTAENIYGLGATDQHGSMGMGDLSGWGAAPGVPGQAGAYPTAGLGAYGHPQAAPPTQQRQSNANTYRQHMPTYGQQDQQKLPYGAQQGMMSGLLQQTASQVGAGGYGALAQQQQQTPTPQQQQNQQQARLPQHYPQAPSQHPLYPGAAAQTSQPGGPGPTPQAYTHSPYGSPMQHQPGRGAPQHVGYGHSALDQASAYGQHVPNTAPPTHHLAAQQQQGPQLGAHPGTHMGGPVPTQQQQHGPSGLSSGPQQQQQQQPQTVSHSLQSQQQQQSQQQPNHVAIMQGSAHQQLPNANLPPPHAMGMPPSYGSHHQQQQQQQQSAPPYMSTASKHQSSAQLNSSPQYRAPFPQLSPQMSPRPPTMSPHPQMSPRPGMSPAKPPQSAQGQQQQVNSPQQQPPTHHSIQGIVGLTSPRPQPPTPGGPSASKSGPSIPPVNTLQALEQMVMPPQGVMTGPSGVPMDYPSAYRQSSQALGSMGPRLPASPQHHQQWGTPHMSMQQPTQQQQPPSATQPNPNAMGMSTSQQLQQHHQQMSMYAQAQGLAHQQQQQQQQQSTQQVTTPPQPSQQQPPATSAVQQQQQINDQLQHSINDIVGSGNQQQSQMSAIIPMQQPQTQQSLPSIHHMSSHHQQSSGASTADNAALLSRNTPTLESPSTAAVQAQPQPQQSQHQSPHHQLQQSPIHQQQSPHHPMQQQQQQHQSYNQPQQQIQSQQQQQIIVDPFANMLSSESQHQQPTQQQQQTSTHQQQQQQLSLSPAHVSSPIPQLQHQTQQSQPNPPTPSTPSHHLSSILNETANSNDSSTLAVAANDSNNSSSNSSTNSIVNNQPTSVHDSNSQSSIISNNQQPLLSGLDSNAMLNNNSNSATNNGVSGGGLLDGGGASLFDNNSMSSTSAAVAAASTAASAAAAMLDSNSQSSTFNERNVSTADEFEKTAPDSETSADPPILAETNEEPVLQLNKELSLETTATQEEQENIVKEEVSVELPPQQTITELASEETKSAEEIIPEEKIQKTVTDSAPSATSLEQTQQQTALTGSLSQQQPILVPQIPQHPSLPQNTLGANYEAQQHLTPIIASYPSGMYPPYPMLHQQEIAGLQQQLQEMYCMPPAHDHQEKIVRLQERLNMLQQHEISEQCAGGPQCMLYQNMPPIYGSTALQNQMVESPQVSSTTGRGRGKGTNKPRKPRAKKGEKVQQQASGDLMDISGNVVADSASIPTTQLPVSEDCVTQGAGDTSVVGMVEYSEGMGDLSQDVHSANELDTSTDGIGKKKKPRKPRTPKDPNKPSRERTPKVKKIKEPNDLNSTESLGHGRKRGSGSKRKKQFGDEDTDKAGEGSEAEDNKPLVCKPTSVDGEPETTSACIDGDAPDYDDIPVSKIPTTKPANDDDKSTEAGDETVDSVPDSAGDATTTPRRRDRKRSGARSRRSAGSDEFGGSTRRRATLSAKALKKRRNRGRIVPESDGEDDTLDRTPPPSPPPDSELDTNKRRSSRNTQRKKYVDDVMLRFSDDDNSLLVASPIKKEKKPSTSAGSAAVVSSAGSDVEKVEIQECADDAASSPVNEDKVANISNEAIVNEASSSTNNERDKNISVDNSASSKPNYVYINTGDEDSMVVQYVLAVRIGKRELIPEVQPSAKVETPSKSEDVVCADAPEKTDDSDSIEKHEDNKEQSEPEKCKEENVEEEDKEKKTEETTEMEVDDENNEKTGEITTENSETKEKSDTIAETEMTNTDKLEDNKKDETKSDEIQPKTENEDDKMEEEEEEDEKDEKDEKDETDENVEKVEKVEKDENVEKVEKDEKDDKEEIDEKEEKDETDDQDEEEEKDETKHENVIKEEDESSKSEEENKNEDKMEIDTTDIKESDENSVDEKTEKEKETIEDAKPEEPESNESEQKKEVVDQSDIKPEPVYIDVEEFFVKYRNFSYLHCEWRTEEELLKGDRRVAAKIRRFQQKQAQQINIFENIEEEPFNQDFIEVDRVLDMSVHTDENSGETTKHYLVKWKSLPYEDCTWELEEDVDDDKIEQYLRFNKLPPRNEWKSKKRPNPEQWKKLEKTPIYKGGNSLRPYQLEGLNWLKFSWFNSHNCILADEMGLGKTIQSLTFVHSVYEYGIRGPFLVIAPLSTIPNWQREFEGWTDMNVVVYHGSVTSKQMIQDYEYYYKTESGKVLKEPVKFNVLITTFEMIVTDHMDLKSFTWRLCVIDEAHRLKNRNCKLLEGLRQLNLEHRVLLSGTPLQNNMSELFSLLNFLEPSQFSSAEEFMSEFGSLRTEEEVNKLQILLKPMMLRRLKDDVEKSLAPKEETIIEVELTNIQKKYYRGILEQNFSFLKKGTTSANIPNLMNTMMELRKCCIHPYLLNGAEEQIQYDYRNQHGEDLESYYKNLIQSAGKMVLIDKLLPKLKANGHRVLIFSQMVRCLDILEDYLVYRKYPFERIDGRIRGNLRQEAIDRYSKPGSDRFVFLLCTKAGGLGINLTAADTVIIYDSDWNPQNDLQAQARCHRIGQRKMVKIYRLLCRNTYEREMFDKASLKLGLDKAVLQSMNTQNSKDGSNKQLSKKEIEDLLKKGAYGAVMDDDNAGDKFCEEDIDSILKRRTQVITMESEKGSTFSKASFAASGNRSDITIDDPDFWTKWAKKADIDPDAVERDETEDLVLSEPRRRTQIKRYGHEDVMEINSDDSSNENSDEEGGIGLRSRRRKEKRDRGREKKSHDDYIPRERDALAALGLEEIQYGNWAKSECFKVEKGLLSFGWGRWQEILELGQFKRGWRDTDVEDCARIILLYCLQVYKGDEKIKTFIWDLITPTEDGEIQKISRDHSGLHNLVPRGRNAKGRNGGKSQKESMTCSSSTSTSIVVATTLGNNTVGQNAAKTTPTVMDPCRSAELKADVICNPSDQAHWSKQEKYDADAYLEGAYKKHLSRHANKVLLRVRMLYYIQHEVIGDLVQQIKDNTPISELPIRPPPTPDQVPSSWWNPVCCDKSLLVGTYKHGCEMYRQIRADVTLCFVSHVGAGDDVAVTNLPINEDDANSKHEDGDEVDDDGTTTKDSDSTKLTTGDNKDSLDLERPSSSGKQQGVKAKVKQISANTVADVVDVSMDVSMDNVNAVVDGGLNKVDSGVVAAAEQQLMENISETQNQENNVAVEDADVAAADENVDNSEAEMAMASDNKADDTELSSVANAADSESTNIAATAATTTTNQTNSETNKSPSTTIKIADDATAIETTANDATVNDMNTTTTTINSCTNATTTITTTTTTTTSTPSTTIITTTSDNNATTTTTSSSTSTKASGSAELTQNENLNSNSNLGLDEEESVAGSYPPTNANLEETTLWPSMQDLNTRLRRVITAYQRNYKKEELKQQQKAKLQALVSSTPPLSVPTTPTLQSMQMQMQNSAASGNNQLQQVDQNNRNLQSLIQGGNNNVSSQQQQQQLPGVAAAGTLSASATPSGTQLLNMGQMQQQQQSQQQHGSQQQQTPLQQQSAVSAVNASQVQPPLPTAADINLMLSILNTTDVSQLANLDINKLAMYLKMERQGKMELAAKEREAQRLQLIPKKWNRREEYEFLRVLTGYGVDLHLPTGICTSVAPDWTKFKQMAHLERKSDETLSDYYKVFVAMCKRQASVQLSDNERGLEGIIDDIKEEQAKLILERLELMSKLRETVRHPQLEERLKSCTVTADTPDWWEPGRHDRELITAVLKHGLYRSETFIFNDPNFSFAESEKRYIRELGAQIQRSIKLETFNAEIAEKMSTTISTQEKPVVKDEIIDLDKETFTKEDIIKIEPLSCASVKEEPQEENSVKKKDVLTTEKTNELSLSENTSDINEIVDSQQTKVTKSEDLLDNPTNDKNSGDASVEGDTKTEKEAENEENLTNLKPDDVDETKKVSDEEESVEKDLEKVPVENENTADKLTDETKEMEIDANVTENKPPSPESIAEVSESVDQPTELSLNKTNNETDDATPEKDETSKTAGELTDEVSMTELDTSNKTEVTEKKKETPADQEILDLAAANAGPTDPDDEEVMNEKEKAVEEECKKQAAELKARFPDLEVIQPATVRQKLEKPKLEMCMIRWFKDYALERRMGHIVTCVETSKWPVDRNYTAFEGCKGTPPNIALHESIPHLNTVDCRSTTPDVITITSDPTVTKHLPTTTQMQQVVSKVVPPVVTTTPTATAPNKNIATPTLSSGIPGLDASSINAAVAAAVAAATAGGSTSSLSTLLPGMSLTAAATGLNSSTANVVTPNTSSNSNTTTNTGKKRKRHIAIDVETERAKLHALLNSSQSMGPKDWENEIANMEALSATSSSSSRRGGSASGSSAMSGLQPPPAHQHASLTRQTSGQFNKPAIPPLKTSSSSIGAPMDLSSGSLPKINMIDMLKAASNASAAIDLSEVQDFSMPSKKSNVHAALSSAFPSLGNKGKLDDTLNKLMKKNNCTIEEPVIGKEKKRKKLDEIVLGLSAAKEQKTFPDPSLPSSKKPQIPPNVSVTPANLQSSMSNQQQQNQKPFTITVTTVPGKSKSGGSNSNANASNSSGLSALQSMSMGAAASSKESLNALIAQTMATDPQTFLKQQQKMMQCLPPAQRKAYENMLAEMEQAMKMSAKYNSHDTKVNKWLSEMSNPLGDQLNMDYTGGNSASGSGSSSSRRSSRQQNNANTQQAAAVQIPKSSTQSHTQQQQQQQQQQQSQQSMAGPQGLTGEEPVPVINKQTGKRLGGNKAPQLKRLMQWLTENPNYEVDPKWLEQMQNPMSAPSPKPMDNSNYSQSASKSHGGRSSSASSNASSSSHSLQQQASAQSSASASATSKKMSRQSAIDQAAMQFSSLAGLNPALLASLPGLNAFDAKNPLSAFDPKNPLLSMPFAGMPGMGNIPGLGNLNNMNLFASLAGMGGLGNLAGLDAQSLAAIMAAAGPSLSGLTGSGSSSVGTTKNQSQSSGGSSSKKNKNDNSQSAAAAANNNASVGGSSGKNTTPQVSAGFPFLFPNPSLLYPPMGLGGLNPYSLGTTGLGSAYDQLAQQYNLLNGATSSSNTNSTQSKSHQTQSNKSNNSRSSAGVSTSAANLMNAMANISGAQSMASTPVTSTPSSSRMRQSSSRSTAAASSSAADMAQLSSLLMPGADPHLLESLSRMAGMDIAQASRLMSSLGMPSLPTSSGSSSSAMNKRAATEASNAASQAEKYAAKEQQKWLESLARGALPTDLAALQAFSQVKLPITSTASTSMNNSISTTSSSSKNSKSAAPQIPGMSSDFSQALLAEMAAQMASSSLPLTGPGSLASLAGLTGGAASGSSSSTSTASSKRQREQDVFKQQMDYYTKTLGLGSGISLIPTSTSGSSLSAAAAYAAALDAEHNKGKRSRNDPHTSKDELTAAAMAAGFPLSISANMSSIEKSLRNSSSASASTLPEADKVTLTPLNNTPTTVGIAANLPSQTTITIAPPISSGASTSSERSERSESRISLTITNAAEAAKLPPPYEEADELIIQPILKKPTASSSHCGSVEDLNSSVANLSGSSTSSAANASTSIGGDDNRRSSNRLKRPRSGIDHAGISEPPEKRRELRSTRHTRHTADVATLNLSTSSETEERNE